MSPTSLQDLKSRKFWLALAAEFLGTMILVLVACGACANFLHAQTDKVVQVSLAFGFSVATIVWSIAHISGGHINPGVTMGFLVTRKISVVRACLYMAVQTLGAVVGAGILKFLTPSTVNSSLGTSMPEDSPQVTVGQTFGIELAITFVLVWTVFATCDGNRKDLAGSGPLAIGIAIAMCHLWAVPYTGSGMNPARVFGAALVSGNLTNPAAHHWAYWVGPLLGGALAGLLYDLVFAVNASVAKVRGFWTRSYDDADYDCNGRKAAADPNQSGMHLKDSA